MDSPGNQPVLVTTDFTEVSDYAIDNAAVMARVLNSKVIILHVPDKYTQRMLKKEKKPESYINEKLETTASQIQMKHGIEAIPLMKKGKLFKIIAETERDNDVLLHFLGTHGKRGLQCITGSFALKLIKRSSVPVVVVQKPAGNVSYKRIVYPLDLQLGSKQKVKWAKILHQAAGSHFDMLVDNYGDKYTDRKLNADLKQVVEILEHNNIPYSSNCAKPRGSFAKQVVEFAKENNADAIMISSDPDKLTCNPFNREEERVLYNPEQIPVMFINSKNLHLVIGGA